MSLLSELDFNRPRYKRTALRSSRAFNYPHGLRGARLIDRIIENVKLAPRGTNRALALAYAGVDRRRWHPAGSFVAGSYDISGRPFTLEVPQVKPWPSRPLRPEERPYYSPRVRPLPSPVVRPIKQPKFVPGFGWVRPGQVSSKVGFRNPLRLVICLKRKLRREAMFALGLRAKGSRAEFHKQSPYSSIRC